MCWWLFSSVSSHRDKMTCRILLLFILFILTSCVCGEFTSVFVKPSSSEASLNTPQRPVDEFKGCMLTLSAGLLLPLPLCLLNRILCSECDTELLSGRGEPQHHTGMEVHHQSWQLLQLPECLLSAVHWCQALRPASCAWRSRGPRVSGWTLCRTSPVGQRRPQRRTSQTSSVQTQDRWLGSVPVWSAHELWDELWEMSSQCLW